MRNENKSLFLCADMQDNCCTENAMLYDAEKAQKCLTCLEKCEKPKTFDEAQSSSDDEAKRKGLLKSMNRNDAQSADFPLATKRVFRVAGPVAFFCYVQNTEAGRVAGFF